MMRNILRTSLLAASFAFSAASAVGQTYPQGACSLIPDSKQCIDTTPCKTLSDGSTACLAGASGAPADAISVPQACWQYAYKFACAADKAQTDTCEPYRTDRNCSMVRSTCANTVAETGACDTWTYEYRCEDPVKTTQQTVCTSGLFAVDPTPTRFNNTFQSAVIATELVRQAQAYSDQGKEIFSGVMEFCTKGYLGIRNCCRPNPGAKSNSAVASAVMKEGSKVVKYAGEVAVDWASPYVFDAMFKNGLWNDAMSVMFSQGASEFSSGSLGTNLAADGFSFGFYGFTFSSSLAEGAVQLATTELGVIAFDPTSFAINLAIQVLQQLATCSQEEEMLAMHRGANLSFYVGRSCAKKFLGSCILWRDNYCSFNSVLSRLINQQGKPQLGLDVMDCKGMTIEQISQIDFSKIDFSEFAGSVYDQATRNLPTNVKGNYTNEMTGKTSGSAQGSPSLPGYTPPPGP